MSAWLLGGNLGCATDEVRELGPFELKAPEVGQSQVSAVVADQVARFLPTPKARAAEPAPGLPHTVSVVESRRLPLEGVLGPAEARGNVDAVRFDERVHLAVRSVDAHGRTRIDVVSSDDGEHTFRRETSLETRGELFAGRLLAWDGALFAYASELDTRGGETKPSAVLASKLDGKGVWADWARLPLDAQVVWRAKVERGTPLLTSYALSEKAYQFEEATMEVRLLTTSDGFDWRPLRSGQRVVYRGGGTEAAFSSDDDGNLYSVVKNEAGDESGFGSALCAARASDWARWDCVNDPKKYDSPTLFTHEDELYLVARRHASPDGYDDDRSFTLLRRAGDQARELAAPQRCALWHFDRAHKRVDFVLDLPSRGNTCSAAVLPGDAAGEYVVYDQSSATDGPDLSLQHGLAQPTYVYRHVLKFEAP